MLPAEATFAAAREIAEAVVAERAAHRKALKDASNARRRARRAASPKPAPKPKAEVLVIIDDDLNYEAGCRCHVVRMPPCSWCENGGDVDADDDVVAVQP